MSTRIYVVNSTGGFVLASTTGKVYAHDILSRYLDLLAPLNARAIRYLDLTELILGRLSKSLDLSADLHAFAKSGYQLYAKNLATAVVTDLGFIDVTAAPLELAGVALADGFYEIEVRLSGYYWKDERCLDRFLICVSAGAVIQSLPAVSGLAYKYNLTDTQLSFNWPEQAATAAPADFGIWTGPADPVDTSGAPAYTVAAAGVGSYSQAIAQGAAILWVAVASRSGGSKGPVSQLQIPAPPAAVASPSNQVAYFKQ